MIAFISPKFRDRIQLNVKIPAFWYLYVAVFIRLCVSTLFAIGNHNCISEFRRWLADQQPRTLFSFLTLCSYLTCSGLHNQRYQMQRLEVMAQQTQESCSRNGIESWDCHIWVSWQYDEVKETRWLIFLPTLQQGKYLPEDSFTDDLFYFLQNLNFYWYHEPAMIQPFFLS